MKNKPLFTAVILFTLFILNLLTACSRLYYASIENNTDQVVKIITTGDSLYLGNNIKLISAIDSTYLYEMNPKSNHLLLEKLNKAINPEDIRFTSLAIILGTDTTFLNGSKEIFESMEKCKNDRVLKIE